MTNAQVWIGDSKPKDSLRVQIIADDLPSQADALRTVLLSAAVLGLDGQRLRLSNEAAAAQIWLKRLAAAAVVGAGVAALASGFLLYGQGADGTPNANASTTLVEWARDNKFLITIIQIAGLFAATVAGGVLAARDYGKIWTERRREAERRRVEIVDRAMEDALAAPGMGNTGLLRQFLEFFRRYQLDLQKRYYFRNSEIGGKSEGWMIWLAAGLAGMATVGGVIGGLGNSIAPVIAAFLGIAVPTVLSSVQSWRTVSRSGEKAAVYRAAGESLENLSFELDKVRAAADAGDVDAVKKFVADVHGIMRTESGAFVGAGPFPAH